VISLELAMRKLGTDSGSVRLDDFKVGYNAWKSNPLFGAGIGNDKYIQSHMSSSRMYNIGFSNSIFQILAHGGLYLALLYFIPLFVGVKQAIKNKNITNMVFVISILYLVTFTIFSYQYLLFYLLIFIWQNKEDYIKEQYP
jgi:O-antigen ligase